MKIEDIQPCMRIRRIGDSLGEVYTVAETSRGIMNVRLEGTDGWYIANAFEYAVGFNMRTDPWFIRINSLHEFEAAQKWLLIAFGSNLPCNYDSDVKVLTNAQRGGSPCRNTVMWDSATLGQRKAYEIKLSFSTVVDAVEWPVVESATQTKIRELEESAKKIQEQIAELKIIQGGE